MASWPAARPPSVTGRKPLAVSSELTISVVTIVNLSHCKFGFPLSSVGKIFTSKIYFTKNCQSSTIKLSNNNNNKHLQSEQVKQSNNKNNWLLRPTLWLLCHTLVTNWLLLSLLFKRAWYRTLDHSMAPVIPDSPKPSHNEGLLGKISVLAKLLHSVTFGSMLCNGFSKLLILAMLFDFCKKLEFKRVRFDWVWSFLIWHNFVKDFRIFSSIDHKIHNFLTRTFIFWILLGAIYIYKVVS